METRSQISQDIYVIDDKYDSTTISDTQPHIRGNPSVKDVIQTNNTGDTRRITGLFQGFTPWFL